MADSVLLLELKHMSVSLGQCSQLCPQWLKLGVSLLLGSTTEGQRTPQQDLPEHSEPTMLTVLALLSCAVVPGA